MARNATNELLQKAKKYIDKIFKEKVGKWIKSD